MPVSLLTCCLFCYSMLQSYFFAALRQVSNCRIPKTQKMTMKKIFAMMAAAAVMTACNNSKKDEAKELDKMMDSATKMIDKMSDSVTQELNKLGDSATNEINKMADSATKKVEEMKPKM